MNRNRMLQAIAVDAQRDEAVAPLLSPSLVLV